MYNEAAIQSLEQIYPGLVFYFNPFHFVLRWETNWTWGCTGTKTEILRPNLFSALC